MYHIEDYSYSFINVLLEKMMNTDNCNSEQSHEYNNDIKILTKLYHTKNNFRVRQVTIRAECTPTMEGLK